MSAVIDLLFGSYIKVAMAAGLTTRDIAHEFDVSVPTVERWVEGKNCPHPALRVHVEAFLNDYLDGKNPIETAKNLKLKPETRQRVKAIWERINGS